MDVLMRGLGHVHAEAAKLGAHAHLIVTAELGDHRAVAIGGSLTAVVVITRQDAWRRTVGHVVDVCVARSGFAHCGERNSRRLHESLRKALVNSSTQVKISCD